MSDNCDGQFENLLSLENAIERLISEAITTQPESILLDEALGRVLAEDIVSPVNVPPAPNSAMDGYAINTADFANVPTRLAVSQYIAAGQMPQQLQLGTAARIFTGAPLPPGANAIVMQEKVECEGNDIIFRECPTEGQFVRFTGEDICRGSTVIGSGTRLRPQHLGLIASTGVNKVSVFQKPRVTLFSTGDELVMPGNDISAGKIFNSNHFTLMGFLNLLGCHFIDGGTLPDSLPALCDTFSQAALHTDLILTSGGASVGEADHLRTAIERLGELNFCMIAVKPGKPLAFGRINATPLIALPGNPVSVFVTFCLLARPYLCKCMGLYDLTLPVRTVQAGFSKLKPSNRREFLRARLEKVQDCEHAILFPNQGSGILTSVAWAEGLVDVPANTSIVPGQLVSFIHFNDLLFT